MTDQPAHGRRAFLGRVGASVTAVGALAGCLDDLRDDEATTVDEEEVDEVLATDAPTVDRPSPVTPAAEPIDEALARVDDLLSRVPSEVDAEAVPNEVIRSEIESIREDAVDRRADVAEESDRYEALMASTRARAEAREAAVAYEAVEEPLAESVDDERAAVIDAVDAALDDVAYVGADPWRTALVAYGVETELETRQRLLTNTVLGPDPSVLDVGEVAGSAERATASIEAAEHLQARHREERGDAETFADPFADAVAATDDALADGDFREVDSADDLAELVDGDVDDRGVERLLASSVRAVQRYADDVADACEADALAVGLDAAIAVERDRRALETVRDRIDDGDFAPLGSIEEVREEREAAIEAARDLDVPTDARTLPSSVAAREVDRIGFVDDSLERSAGHAASYAPHGPYAEYAHQRARLEALPAAIDTVRDRMGT